jgi:peptidoglycan/LPS O-acetylase OafA/YrhL
VISGYLITRLIIAAPERPLAENLAAFYERRIRRILPALVVLLAVVTVAGLAILLPADLRKFGKFVAATSAFLTNVAAWSETGYFAEGAAANPLLHLWSIAVEEQYYVAYPVLLFLVRKHRSDMMVATVAVLMAASLALSVWGAYSAPSGTFYGAPTRAWEFLLGAIICLGAMPMPTNRVVREVLALAAISSIVAPVYFYTNMTEFPGAAALLPCAGAALLIALGAERTPWTNRMLSVRILVFTGLISYSMYLWHAPILALFTYYRIERARGYELLALLVAIYAIAFVSWKFVELPPRAKAAFKTRFSLSAAAASATLLLGLGGVALWASNGLPGRFPEEALSFAETAGDFHKDFERCTNRPASEIASGVLCQFGEPGAGRPRIVVWGDSHAGALLTAYEALAKRHGVSLYFGAEAGCRPLLGMVNRRHERWRQDECLAFNQAMVSAVKKLDPHMVVLSAHWIDVDEDLISAGDSARAGSGSNFMHGLLRTLEAIDSPRRMTSIVLGVPNLPYPAPHALAIATIRGQSPEFLRVSRRAALEQYRAVELDFRWVSRQFGVRLADPKDSLCRTTSCEFISDGKSLYSDAGHLSPLGALFVAGSLAPIFESTPEAAPQQLQ